MPAQGFVGDLAIAVLSASQKAPLSVAFADGARPAHRRRGGRSSRGAPRRPSGQGRHAMGTARSRATWRAQAISATNCASAQPLTSSPRRRPARSMAAGGRSGASATAAARRAGQSRCCSRHAPLVGAGTAGIRSAQRGDGRIRRSKRSGGTQETADSPGSAGYAISVGIPERPEKFRRSVGLTRIGGPCFVWWSDKR